MHRSPVPIVSPSFRSSSKGMEAEPSTVPSLGFRWPSRGKIPKKSSQIPSVFAMKTYKYTYIMSLKLTNHTWKIDASKTSCFFSWDGSFSREKLLVSGRVNVSNQSMVHLPNLEPCLSPSASPSKPKTWRATSPEGCENYDSTLAAQQKLSRMPGQLTVTWKKSPPKKIHHSLFHPLFLLH